MKAFYIYLFCFASLCPMLLEALTIERSAKERSEYLGTWVGYPPEDTWNENKISLLTFYPGGSGIWVYGTKFTGGHGVAVTISEFTYNSTSIIFKQKPKNAVGDTSWGWRSQVKGTYPLGFKGVGIVIGKNRTHKYAFIKLKEPISSDNAHISLAEKHVNGDSSSLPLDESWSSSPQSPPQDDDGGNVGEENAGPDADGWRKNDGRILVYEIELVSDKGPKGDLYKYRLKNQHPYKLNIKYCVTNSFYKQARDGFVVTKDTGRGVSPAVTVTRGQEPNIVVYYRSPE